MEVSALDIEDIVLDQKKRANEYFVDTIQHIHVNDHSTENRISTRVQKEYIRTDNFGYLVQLDLLERKQSNTEGMLAVEDRLSILFQKLTLYVSDEGKIKSVANLKEIKQDWFDQKRDFKKEFSRQIDKIDDFLEMLDLTLDSQKDFIQMLTKSDIITLIVPPIYSQDLLSGKAVKNLKVYDNFFGNNNVPIRIDTTLRAYNEVTKGYQVSRSGDIDYVRVDTNGIKNFFRKNYNNQSLPIKLDVAYLEAFDLDTNNDVDIASLMIGIEIKDLYQFRQISKAKKIN